MFKNSPWISLLIPTGENELLKNHIKDYLARAPKVRPFAKSTKRFGPSRLLRHVGNLNTDTYPSLRKP